MSVPVACVSLEGAALGPLGGNREPEQAALSRRALAADLALHQLDQPLGDGEAEPGAAKLARAVRRLGIRLEQPLLLELAEADACVGDVEAQFEPAACLAGIGMQTHRACRGELHGVVDEVGEHLANTARIAGDETRAARTDIDDAFDAFLPRPRLQFAADAPHQLMQIEHRVIELEAACLEL